MEIKKETFKSWNKLAKRYQDKFMDLDFYNASYDLFLSLINSMGFVLDAGCGPGNISKYLISENPNLKIHGIDIAPNMLELAIKNCPSANFNILDLRSIHQLKSKYDAIVCGFALPYLSRTETNEFIINCFNTLSMDGVIYLSFVHGNPEDSGFISGTTADRMYFYFHDIVEVKLNLTNANFEVLEVLNVAYPKQGEVENHTIIIARKGKS